ncbi:pre-rRNA-processing protein ESF1 [Oryza brachyantha]|uniref:pre-rRNA-processing protein ESF1 n=1 Tax=Oryza brachyantha TaxID=4533 RepID=UPI0007764B46|nr:pre-rRNA-processing protein ESF1 [Oryza brachyantha]XP_006657789.2 pre-rRNA-processing protein ESF1 [Oryza brachyantha]
MAPPANSDELARSRKAEKSRYREERERKKGKHERPAATGDAREGKGKKRKEKEKDGKVEEEEGEHGKRRPKERKGDGEAVVVEAGGEETRRGDDKVRRAMEDERFAAARTDPRFRPMRRKEAKVELDSRFTSMLTDPRFSSSAAPVDKHGRRRKKGENPMVQYYLNQEEEEVEKEKAKAKLIEEDEEEEAEEELQDKEESSSSDDDEEDEEEDDDEYSVGSDVAHYLMGRHDDTPMIDKETHRLAVVNMDWDHIKAVDLYMVMTSCLPKGGRVSSVSIYPSEFGLKCMKIESTKGPAALVDANGNDGENSDDNDDNEEEEEDSSDTEHDSEAENNKLRSYELNRLRYYYAVVVCDSSATANHLYMNLDGTELLKTSNVFDLQFIPDSMEFKHPARDVATEAPPNYKEPNFETRALQHSRVKLTWDDDEPERKKVLRRKFNDDQLDDLDMYLASDYSASDDEGADNHGDESLQNGSKRKLTREERLALLLGGDKSEEEQTEGEDMEITFNTELDGLGKRILDRKISNEKTVWEKHQEKMKEKRKARKKMSKDDDGYSSEGGSDEHDDFFDEEMSDDEIRTEKKQKAKAKHKAKRKGKDKLPEKHLEDEATREELELLVATDKDAAKSAKGYNLKRKKGKKGKKGKEQSVEDELPEIDLSKDERFSAMFTSHLFALDPTDPQYKRSAAFMCKQAGRKGTQEPSPRGRDALPPDDVPTDTDQRPDGTSTEKLDTISAVTSLKRKLTAFKNTSTSD